ncbi:hypothetical protein L7F22_026690 [Adiantum nelumboides]|nr:hypothetical protein [Adiantum nelumboides]
MQGTSHPHLWLERLASDSARSLTLHARASGAPISSGYEIADNCEYFARIGLGSSFTRRDLYFIIDTGSDLSWVQCAPCNPCHSQLDESIFDPEASETMRNVSCDSLLCTGHGVGNVGCGVDKKQCKYVMRYGDGSQTMGDIVTDTISFGAEGASLPNMLIGCGQKNDGSFKGAAGIYIPL